MSMSQLCENLLADAQKPDAERNRLLCLDAVARIQVLETTLRKIDNAITWETTMLGRSFQGEIERVLK
jgi:hypothetical protein